MHVQTHFSSQNLNKPKIRQYDAVLKNNVTFGEQIRFQAVTDPFHTSRDQSFCVLPYTLRAMPQTCWKQGLKAGQHGIYLRGFLVTFLYLLFYRRPQNQSQLNVFIST